MKKNIGYILSCICFSIGDAFCKISYIKSKGEYYFDKPSRQGIGMWLCNQYQRFMHYSLRFQEWAGNERPWRKPTQQEIDIEVG